MTVHSVRDNLLKGSLLLVWSVLLTVVTVVFAAPVMFCYRRLAGPWIYWISCLLLAVVFFAAQWKLLAGGWLLMCLLTGIFRELDRRGFTLFTATGVSLFITSVVFGSAFWIWTQEVGKQWYAELAAVIEKLLNESQLFQTSEVKIVVDDIVQQVPSALIILLMFATFLIVLFERRITRLFGLVAGPDRRLSEFKLPDALIWVLIPSLLAGLWEHGNETLHMIGANILNVCVFAYFFQGLSVMAKAFTVYKVGLIWRIFITMIMVIQLFWLVSIIGISDYWFNWRARMMKKKNSIDKRM